jgi:tRNA pseudouridine32 synthase/23S rRNA pseudouridine746 synthase
VATHRLERDAAAEAEARALMARIRAAGRLDFDREVPDPRFGVETMYEPGGGKMLGVLLAERAETSPGSTRNSTLDATREASRATSTKASNATKTKEIVVLKAFSGQMRGEWRVPGWAPPLCALTHDAPRYAEAHEKIAAATAAARARSAEVAEMEARLLDAREPWDARIREAAETAKEARRARRARRRAFGARNARNAQNAPTSARDARDDARRLAFETKLAEESRADKREMARLREARAAATAPLESALAAAREDARGLRDAHRSMSASLLAEIFDSYRLPNFREAFGFGDRLRKRADTTGETRAREAPGATLAECFVADEAAAARAAEVSAEVSAARASLPCGCGDCCAPKLLAECALRGLKPLSIAEVWMGVSTREEGDREEGEFYGACRGRCRPILGHMLCGADALNPRTKEKLGGPIVL